MTQHTDRPFPQTQASVHLDAMRGVAAVLVVVFHMRGMLYVPFDQVAGHRGLAHGAYMLAGLGHQAVVIFFVLSGFLVGGTALRSFERGQWSWRRYMMQRLVRMWVVLLPALALGALMDRIALWRVARHSTAQALYLLEGVPERLNVRTFAGCAAFVQTMFVPVLGSNVSLWSLANEFWYYVLFPLALCTLWPRRSGVSRLLYAVAVLGVGWMVGKDILELAPLWVLGALLHYAPRRQLKRGVRVVCAAAYPFAVILAASGNLHHFNTDYLLAIATAAFLWVLLSSGRAEQAGGVYSRWARRLASFSFTLYLTHRPLVTLVGCFAMGRELWQPDPKHAAAGFVLLVALLGYAWAMAGVTEYRTDEVRMWVEGLSWRGRVSETA
jgi:peptidoglycan/LPS O-acetylase OafA/YrhL